MSDHSSHDFLDKYDYSKSNNEIVKNIMKNFILSIQEKIIKIIKRKFLIFY
jgi:hypothetical protein